jgi:CYTH domain-containing protein
MASVPKYSAIEIERRWLVDLSVMGDLDDMPFRKIEDLYIEDSRLRLRKVTECDGRCIFKFGKKYGKSSMSSEPVTNLYLTEAEHERLSRLPGAATLKRRYSVAGGALDVYERPRAGLAVFEIEFDDEESAETYRPPHFVTREITGESSFSGVSMAEAHAA